ncbi:MAG: DUF3817 domain-containing protein [Chitinophagaceae bacterium]|nr:DUF3817 domain-containing protein [Chitinophagaceae bacterium]
MKLNFSNTSIGRLRLAGITEGISFLVLLFIAMPLKYMADIPEAVKYTGWVHGLLFIFYLFALTVVKITQSWSLKKTAISFLASLIPFGTFVMDREWKKEEQVVLALAKKS